MKSGFHLPLALATLLALGACSDAGESVDPLGTGPLFTQGPKLTDFQADEAICVFAPDLDMLREVNGVLHFRGIHVETLTESEDPRYSGTSVVELRGHRDLATGQGRGFGRVTFQPDGVDGTWEGTFTGQWTPAWVGRGVYHGTGELRGRTVHVRQTEVIVDPAERLCPQPPAMTGPPLQFLNSVRIIDPGS